MINKNNLILVGTAHFDLRGTQRLSKLLDHLAPDILTLEYSKEKRELGQKLENQVKEIIEQKGVDFDLFKKSQDFYRYELKVCDKYAKNHKIPLHEIDFFSSEEKSMWERKAEEFKTAKITNANLEYDIQQVEEMLNDSEFLLEFDTLCYTKLGLLAMFAAGGTYSVGGKRDKHMAEQLTNLINCYPDSKIVHVGGAAHVVDHKKEQIQSIYSLLPQSKVYFLNYADRL